MTESMRGTYAPTLVVLSVLVATLASYSALRIADRISRAEAARTRRRWLAAGSLVMGYGVWAMHFIGMLAFRLPIPVAYDVPITALSVVPAIAASVVALHVVARKDPQRWLLITGGALMGAGIGAMHYTGMGAMQLNAEMRYDPLLFGVSIVVAVGLATVALYSHVVASARTVTSLLHWTQTGAAAVMGFAVAGMHYTGMAAVEFVAAPGLNLPIDALDVNGLALAVSLASIVITGLAVFFVVVDTRLTDATRSARTSQARLREAIDSMADGFSLWDADDRLIAWNSTYGTFYADARLTQGTRFEDVVRYTATRGLVGVPEHEIDLWVQSRLRMFHEKQHDLLQTADGRWIQIGVSHTERGETVVIYSDVSGLKRAEADVRAHSEQLGRQALEARLLHDASETAAETESLEDALQKVVDLVCAMTTWPVGHVYEVSSDDPLTLTPTHVWHLSDPQEFQVFRDVTERSTFRVGEGLSGRILESGEPAWIVDVQVDPNFPRNRLAEDLGVNGAAGFPVKIGGHVVAVLEFFAREPLAADESLMRTMRNVGDQLGRVFERKRASDALRRAREAADEANRAKSRFLSNMSHELRTPLNGVLGYAQILQRDQTLSTTHRESLGAIESCGEHLLALINDVLDFSRIESGQLDLDLGPCDLPNLLSSASDIVQPRADDKGLTLTILTAPDVPHAIQADQAKLRQVLVNLLGNAIKFTDRGSVTLEVSEDASDHLVFTVRDTGVGISEVEREAIFDPFRQAEAGKANEGTGLGLAISRRLIEAMGGTLTVASEVGQGSAFTMSIPFEEVPEPLVTETEMAPADYGPRKLAAGQEVAVLVADDRQTNRDILVKLLAGAGFATDEARNGEEALAKLRAGRFQLVLMDVRMPIMNGLEATRIIRGDVDLRDIIVIAVSASAFPNSRERVIEAGCDDFLSKPLRAAEVFEKIARHLKLGLVDAVQPVDPVPRQAGHMSSEQARVVAQRLRTAIDIGDVSELTALAEELGGEPGPASRYGQDIDRLTRAFDFDGLRRVLHELDQTDGDREDSDVQQVTDTSS